MCEHCMETYQLIQPITEAIDNNREELSRIILKILAETQDKFVKFQGAGSTTDEQIKAFSVVIFSNYLTGFLTGEIIHMQGLDNVIDSIYEMGMDHGHAYHTVIKSMIN